MRRGLYSSIAIAALMCVGANAAPPQLKGRYAYTGWGSCQFAGLGFFSVTQPPTITPPDPGDLANHTRLFVVPPSTGNFSMFNGQGLMTFDGNGHGHHEGTSVAIFPAGSVSSSSFDFTYKIDSYGLLRTQLVPGSFKTIELNLDGSESDSTWTTDKLTLVGMIGNNGSVITLATELPEIETQTYLTGPQAGRVQQRVCSRTRTLTWLGGKR
jgi:hypothetical protein